MFCFGKTKTFFAFTFHRTTTIHYYREKVDWSSHPVFAVCLHNNSAQWWTKLGFLIKMIHSNWGLSNIRIHGIYHAANMNSVDKKKLQLFGWFRMARDNIKNPKDGTNLTEDRALNWAEWRKVISEADSQSFRIKSSVVDVNFYESITIQTPVLLIF